MPLPESEISQLKEQIVGLAEQVAALTMQKKEAALRRCFFASKWVIFSVTVLIDVKTTSILSVEGGPDHTACWQGNSRGMPVVGNKRPQQ